jgi:RND family efflux transporter MFP subunit
MKSRTLTAALALTALAVAGGATLAVRAADPPPPAAPAKPALTVQAVTAAPARLARTLAANGGLHPWQEAVIGAEANGWRLAEVAVNVGDRVRRGQVLARFAVDLPRADLAQTEAAVAEAEALLAEAAANAQRARDLHGSGMMSAQQINQVLTAERTAQARLQAQRAAAQVQRLRLAQAEVRAPDDGVISSRSATVGAVVPAGAELFRLIRQGRLEWRAEVPADQLALVRTGQPVRLTPVGGPMIAGRVRMVAPTVDAAARQGLVYVDLPQPGAAKAGMFARGEIVLGEDEASTLPQSAVLLRDGFHVVFVIGADGTVAERKVEVGRRAGDRIELIGGLPAGARVVARGGAFLADGDLVRVGAD